MMDIKYIKRLITRKIWAILAGIHTHVLVQVVSYDENENTASVRPCVNRLRTMDPNNETTIAFGLLEDVPVVHKGSGKLLFGCAPQAGSYGLLHVAERSTDVWLTKGGIDDPDSVRKFDENDGFLEVGAYPLIVDGDNGKLSAPIRTDRIELRTRLGTSFVAVKDDGAIEIEADKGKMSLAMDGEISALNDNGTFVLKADGTIEANGNSDFAVAYTDLKSAFDTLKSDFDSLVSTYNAHIHITTATVGVGPVGVIAPTTSVGTPSTADMSGAKVDTVKLP